jgi:Domain of unknown function (DUF1963)
VLTHDEIRAVGSDLGLGVVVEGLIAALVPAYRLEPSPDGAHRIGGEPDLVAGETWPRNERGAELTFIAQFDVGQIPVLPGGSTEVEAWCASPSFVRLFADLYDHPFEANAITALGANPLATRTRAATPIRGVPATDPQFAIAAFREQTVDALPCWCLDVEHPAVFEAEAIDDVGAIENAPLLELSHRLHAGRSLSGGWHVLPQLLGLPAPVQDDPRYGAAAYHVDASLRDRTAWTLLLQFDDTFASYGDGGGFFVVIPRADLAAGRYDRAVAESQSL